MAATRSIGTTLVKTNGVPKIIADLTSIGAFGIVSNEIDVTTLDSPGNFKEFIGGFKDAGEFSISGLIKSPDNFEDLLGYANTQAINAWRVQFPDGSKFDFSAWVKEFQIGDSTADNVMNFKGVFRITGVPTFTITGGGVSA